MSQFAGTGAFAIRRVVGSSFVLEVLVEPFGNTPERGLGFAAIAAQLLGV